MPKPNPTGVRFAPETRDRIKDLARWWGPVQELDLSAVVREAVARAHEAEEKKRKKISKGVLTS